MGDEYTNGGDYVDYDIKVRDQKLPKHHKELFPRPYLRAHDLQGKAWNVRVEGVKQAHLFDTGTKKKKWKWVVYFSKMKKFVIMSGVISDQISEATGITDPEKWKGELVTLYAKRETHGGRAMDVIRVRKAEKRAPKKKTTAKTKTAPKKKTTAKTKSAPAAAKKAEGKVTVDDPIPFTPEAQRIAKANGVDLDQVQGSGAGGVILDKDVKQFIQEREKKKKAVEQK